VEVLILLIFVSLLLAASAVGLFVWLAKQRTFEHGERLELLPMDTSDEKRS
jgi:cbb3-type cytochrome oxidase maturation protein